MYGKMQASGLPESIPFVHASALWGQTLFPCLPQGVVDVADGCLCHHPHLQLLSSQRGGGQHLLDHSFGSLHSRLQARNQQWL